MISRQVRQGLSILSIVIMIGSLLLVMLGTVVTLYVEIKEGPMSDGPFTMFLEGPMGGFIMGLIAAALLRTLLSIDARLEQRA